MKNVLMIVVLMLVCITGSVLADIGYSNVAGHRVMDGTMDNFVKQKLEEFEGDEGYHNRAAFAQPFAWGSGQYVQDEVDTIRFSWFAYTNTDAYLQFELSAPMLDGHLIKLERIRDILGRTWDTMLDSAMTMTWIGTSNCWMDQNQIKTENGYYIDEEAVITEALEEFNGLAFILEMKVTGYLK